MLLTDNEVLIKCAGYFYNTFKVPTMLVDSKKRKRKYTSEDKAALDIFCDSDNIGIVVNLSQEINTIMWDRINRRGDWEGAMDAYRDNCLLSVLSSIIIDSTKKEYAIDCMKEFRIIRAKYNSKDDRGRAIRPFFFGHVAKKKGFYDSEKKNYKRQLAPMDFVQAVVNRMKSMPIPNKSKRPPICSISDILKDLPLDESPRQGYVELVLAMVRDLDAKNRTLYQIKNTMIADTYEKRRVTNMYFERYINGIKGMHLNKATLRELLVEMEKPENSRIRRRLWALLFGSLAMETKDLLKEATEPIYMIQECAAGEEGDVDVYWLKYKRVLIEQK